MASDKTSSRVLNKSAARAKSAAPAPVLSQGSQSRLQQPPVRTRFRVRGGQLVVLLRRLGLRVHVRTYTSSAQHVLPRFT